METLDWLVIGIFFLALIGIIVWVVKQKQNDSADYFLGGRDATWLAIGASIFASNIGSGHLIGLPGAGASCGRYHAPASMVARRRREALWKYPCFQGTAGCSRRLCTANPGNGWLRAKNVMRPGNAGLLQAH